MVIAEKEARRNQALAWAKEYKRRTGEGPGKRGYIDSFFYGYFGHAMARSDGIEGDVIAQFETLLDRIAALEALQNTGFIMSTTASEPTFTFTSPKVSAGDPAKESQ